MKIQHLSGKQPVTRNSHGLEIRYESPIIWLVIPPERSLPEHKATYATSLIIRCHLRPPKKNKKNRQTLPRSWSKPSHKSGISLIKTFKNLQLTNLIICLKCFPWKLIHRKISVKTPWWVSEHWETDLHQIQALVEAVWKAHIASQSPDQNEHVEVFWTNLPSREM